MEPLWSPVVAAGGNRWQITEPQNRQKQAKTVAVVATGCRTLFMLAADWRGPENVDDVVAARTGQVLIADAPAPGLGWP
jgi:hypothetical protein